jgi:hypothetical protein
MSDDDLTIAYQLGVEDMRSKLRERADEIERLRAENETLRRDVKTAVMGDSAELQDVKRENEKLHREAAIRIDQIEREQEAHLRTIADYNRAAVENEKLRRAMHDIYEVYAGYDGILIETSRDYLKRMIIEMSKIAAEHKLAAAAAIRESGE